MSGTLCHWIKSVTVIVLQIPGRRRTGTSQKTCLAFDNFTPTENGREAQFLIQLLFVKADFTDPEAGFTYCAVNWYNKGSIFWLFCLDLTVRESRTIMFVTFFSVDVKLFR